MNIAHNDKFMPHRPSRGYKRVASSTANSGMGEWKHATADASLLSSDFPSSHPNPTVNLPPSYRNIDTVACPKLQFEVPYEQKSEAKPLFAPRNQSYIAAFNVRTLKPIGQQIALAQSLNSLHIDVCCISETRIQDASSVLVLSTPNDPSRFYLRTSGDPEAAASGSAGVGVALSRRAEDSLVEWIPVNSRLCAVRLSTSVKADRNREYRCLFIVSAYAPTNCSSDSCLFKDGGEALCESLLHLCLLIWSEEKLPDNWGESTVVHIFKRDLKKDVVTTEG